MIYIFVLVLIFLVIFLTKKRLDLAMVLSLAMSVLASSISLDLSQFLIRLGLNIGISLLNSWVYLIIILLPVLIVLKTSEKRPRSLVRIIIETCLFFGLLLILIVPEAGFLLKTDQISVEIYKVLINNNKIVIIASSLYGFWQTIKRIEE